MENNNQSIEVKQLIALMKKSVRRAETAMQIIDLRKENLTPEEIFELIQFNKKRDDVLKAIIGVKKDTITGNIVQNIMLNAKDPDDIAQYIISNVPNLSDVAVYYIIINSINKKKVASILGKENLSKLSEIKLNSVMKLIGKDVFVNIMNNDTVDNPLPNDITALNISEIIYKKLNEMFDSEEEKTNNPNAIAKDLAYDNPKTSSKLIDKYKTQPREEKGLATIIAGVLVKDCAYLKKFKVSTRYDQLTDSSEIKFNFNNSIEEKNISIILNINYFHNKYSAYNKDDYYISFHVNISLNSNSMSAPNPDIDSVEEDEKFIDALSFFKRGTTINKLREDIKNIVCPSIQKLDNYMQGKYDVDMI